MGHQSPTPPLRTLVDYLIIGAAAIAGFALSVPIGLGLEAALSAYSKWAATSTLSPQAVGIIAVAAFAALPLIVLAGGVWLIETRLPDDRKRLALIFAWLAMTLPARLTRDAIETALPLKAARAASVVSQLAVAVALAALGIVLLLQFFRWLIRDERRARREAQSLGGPS